MLGKCRNNNNNNNNNNSNNNSDNPLTFRRTDGDKNAPRGNLCMNRRQSSPNRSKNLWMWIVCDAFLFCIGQNG